MERYFKVLEDIGMSEHLTRPEKKMNTGKKKNH